MYLLSQNILLANIGQLEDLDDYLDEQTTDEPTTEKQQTTESKPRVTFKTDDTQIEAHDIHNEAEAVPPLSPDGKYVVLLDNTDQSDAPVKSADVTQPIGDEEEPESEA